MRSALKCFLTALLASVSLTLEGQSGKIVFMPQWTVQSQFAGYYAALENGYYKEKGLDVRIVHPSASNTALNNLTGGHCDIITMQLMQAMRAIDRGTEVVNILQTSQHNSLLIIPRQENIRSLADLKGKRVGIWKAGFGELGYILDREKELGIDWIRFVNGVNLFVSGAVDATLAMSYNEYYQIQACGIMPRKVFRLSALGYDIPEEGLYVTRDYYLKHRKECELFAEATRKGWEWVRDHREEALDIVMEYGRREHVRASRVLQKKMLDEVLLLQCDVPHGKPVFTLLPEHVQKASAMLEKNGFIKNDISYSEITGKR